MRYQKRKAKRDQEQLQAIIEERTRELKLQNEQMQKKNEEEKVNNWITIGLAQISETISKNNGRIDSLGREALKCIVKYTNAQQGILAIGTKDKDDIDYLKVIATYGVARTSIDERIEVGSGLLGETYRDREKKQIDNVPSGYLKIESGLGQALPAKIILVPLQTDDGETMGVMELGFLGAVPEEAHLFLSKACSVLALNIFATTLTEKTMLLLQQSKEQTEELRAQEEEMRQNMEELEATGEEFRRRELEYQKRIQELQQIVRDRVN